MLCLSVGTKIFNPFIHCQIDVYGEVTQCINYGVTTLRKLAMAFFSLSYRKAPFNTFRPGLCYRPILV